MNKSEIQTADTGAPDSNDYSSWFQGISQSEIDDFETQDDADQVNYPSEIPEPDHDPEPPSFAPAGHSSVAATLDPFTPSAAGAFSSGGIHGGGGHGGGGGEKCGGSCHCGTVTVTGSATLAASFNVSVRDQFLGTFGPVRRHNVWANGSASGTANLTLSGSLTATGDSWSATIAVSGTADTTVHIHAHQELVGIVRRWFAVGDATLSGDVTFSDSVTFTKTCDPPGAVVTTPGTPALGVDVTVDDVTFYGFFFPRLQGPVVTRIRGAISQFARNFANRQLAGLIQPRVLAANQAYAAKKQELLNQLLAALPAGCGCTPPN